MLKAKLYRQNHTKKHTHTHSQKEKKEKNIYIQMKFNNVVILTSLVGVKRHREKSIVIATMSWVLCITFSFSCTTSRQVLRRQGSCKCELDPTTSQSQSLSKSWGDLPPISMDSTPCCPEAPGLSAWTQPHVFQKPKPQQILLLLF